MNRPQPFPQPRAGAARLDDAVVAGALAESPHRPMMLREVLACLQPRPGDRIVDATLGGGGHAQALLAHIGPRGRLLGLDVDAGQLGAATERLRTAGFGPDVFLARRFNFADLPTAMSLSGIDVADAILVDLGISSLQLDDPARGFRMGGSGPLDLRMDRDGGETAAALVARTSETALAELMVAGADEPHAAVIAAALVSARPVTTQAFERAVRAAVAGVLPDAAPATVKASVRRTLQALRIAVNDELSALERLLDVLPQCLSPGGRVAILTFHSGEDRRVKQAFRAGQRTGVYASVAREVIRSTKEETWADRRAMAAKLRWAVRASERRVR